ncbi:putative bgh specific protein [Golovinomyces cichoracearum]|uniref:Putative bgh specific protein n=1 Tax=Golovinomyces cichoracearum TaxID=62708 RepID=A0A420IHR2_9PEZI|nr:putative bgh specific protein [Golovinomyces cichoracearum]
MASYDSRQNFPHKLQTNDLTSNSDYAHRDLEVDKESDSSSICHSPCWDDISGKKSKNEKRKKKQQEKELEKAREKEQRFSLKASELASAMTRTKKLKKLPPNLKSASKISSSEKQHDPTRISPSIQHENSTEFPASREKNLSSNIDNSTGSLLACISPFAANASHPSTCHPNIEFLGGLKLRRAEEANVQEAIRQVKFKDRNENRYYSREAMKSRKSDSSTVDLVRRYHDNGAEWPSRNKEQLLRKEFNRSSSFKGPEKAEDFFSISRSTKEHQDSPKIQSSSDVGRSKDMLRENKSGRPLRDFHPCHFYSQSSQTIDNKIPKPQSPKKIDRLSIQSSQTIDKNFSYPQSPDTLDHLSNLGVAISHSDTEIAESFMKRAEIQRSKRPRGSKFPAPIVVGTLRHTTKQLDQTENETILAPNSAPLRSRSVDAQNKSPPIYGLRDVTSASYTEYSQFSNHPSPDSISVYSVSSQTLASTKHRSWSDQATYDLGIDVGLASPGMEITQESKKLFGNDDDTHQRNSTARFSHAVSTDSSEEYSTQDDLSNITTPTESRPHSSKEKSPKEYQNEAWSEQMVARLELQVESEQDVESKMDGQKNSSKSYFNTTGRSNNVPRDTKVLPLNVPNEQIQQSNVLTSRSKDLYNKAVSQQDLPQSVEEQRPWGPLRGLIKKPQKQNKPSNPQNHNINSDVRDYSQYLQEARSRIGTSALSSRTGRSNRNFLVAQTAVEPFAKMFVVCCSCKYFHDLPSKLYACMSKPDDLVAEEKLGVSGVITTTVKCPWCGHGMSSSCCAGYATVVYLKERLH